MTRNLSSLWVLFRRLPRGEESLYTLVCSLSRSRSYTTCSLTHKAPRGLVNAHLLACAAVVARLWWRSPCLVGCVTGWSCALDDRPEHDLYHTQSRVRLDLDVLVDAAAKRARLDGRRAERRMLDWVRRRRDALTERAGRGDAGAAVCVSGNDHGEGDQCSFVLSHRGHVVGPCPVSDG